VTHILRHPIQTGLIGRYSLLNVENEERANDELSAESLPPSHCQYFYVSRKAQ